MEKEIKSLVDVEDLIKNWDYKTIVDYIVKNRHLIPIISLVLFWVFLSIEKNDNKK